MGRKDFFCFWLWRLRCHSRREKPPSRTFPSSSSSDIGNSKLGESTWLKCSTGLLIHDLILTSKYKLWLCSYFRVIKEFFGFFVLPFFQNKHKRDSRDRNDVLLMMENTWSKKPYFRLGRDERTFLKSSKQQPYLNEQMSSRKNIHSDPIAATRSDSNIWKARHRRRK